MTERQINMNYLKEKYIEPTWENMLEECREWYKEGLEQGKFDKEMEKQELISFLESMIIKYEEEKREKEDNIYTILYTNAKIGAYQNVLIFINRDGK